MENISSERIRQEILSMRYDIWRSLLRDLHMSAETGHTVARFPNSSTYIFSTGANTFWMMDPAFSRSGESQEEVEQIAELIKEKIHFIVLTHLHGDHCQFELGEKLTDAPIRWVVPAVCAEQFLARIPIPKENLTVLEEGKSCELFGIRITACQGYHKDPVKLTNPPSAAYEIFLPDGIKLFFPGDVRNYHLPLPDHDPVDYTFGHVFLGREDATGNAFSLLDDFCHFMTQKKPDNLLLTHLYEVGRQPKDMWTCRHGAMIRERMKEIEPQTRVLIPRFGDSIHLVKDQSRFQDPFLSWSEAERDDFLASLGISIKMNHCEWMERAVAEKVPVLEWMPAHALKIPYAVRAEQLKRWRDTCGKCLSVHLPNFPLRGEPETGFSEAVKLALESRANRVTVHVPNISVGEAEQCMEEITDRILELTRPLLDAGIVIGIENLHMKPKHPLDERRPFGVIPPECIRIVKRLREKSNSGLWGVHFDIGHAYANPPYCMQYDTQAWLSECGPLLNGIHLHQFECPRTDQNPFLSGHGNITSRNTGHPSLLPLFEAWKNHTCHVPMFLEVMRGTEPDPFSSLARLRREPF